MKYSTKTPPMVCMMTNSSCYKGTSTMQIQGILWHSTGANNPTLKRYVQPDDNAPNKDELIAKIGKNKYGNDYNHSKKSAGLNAWIGKLEDGTVAAVQVMPWNYRPWGCASGKNGSCNNGWIQFEICEDNLKDEAYFNAVYKEACELTAYLCKVYNIAPEGFHYINGVRVPTILCHQDSYVLGMGSNHSDIYHWFKKYGKDMDTVRKDVAALIGKEIKEDTYMVEMRTLQRGHRGEDVKSLQILLNGKGFKCGTADGIFGANTEKAVKAFQKSIGATQDGYAGKITMTALINGK